MNGLPFALLHLDDIQTRRNVYHEKKAMLDNLRSGSTFSDSTRTSYFSGSDNSTPSSSECESVVFSPSEITDDSLENNLPLTGLESVLESVLEATSMESTVLPPCACRWTAEELVKRQVLMDGEEIVLCSNSVRCGFSLSRKNVLMLTNMPRLLILSPSCRDVLKQIPLRSDGTSLVARAPRDFQVRALGKIYHCYDAIVGADMWKQHVEAARNKAKQGHFF